MYHPVGVWLPCPLSSALPSGETPRGISPTGGSEPTSRTRTEAPLAPLPHKTSLTFSYFLPPLPISSPTVPKFSHALRRFRSTSSQSLSKDYSICPRYLNKDTSISGVPYAETTLPIRSSVSSATNLRRLLSVLRRHIVEVGST